MTCPSLRKIDQPKKKKFWPFKIFKPDNIKLGSLDNLLGPFKLKEKAQITFIYLTCFLLPYPKKKKKKKKNSSSTKVE